VNIKEMRDKTEAELETREKELSEQLFKLRFQRATGRIENPMKIREVKREIARIKTLLKERAVSA
jgi:large subunit ribosomal protein L29